jgi:hypothetical protein
MMHEPVHENVIFPSSPGRPSEYADSFCWESVNHQVGFSCPYRAGRLALLLPMLPPRRARSECNKQRSRFMFNSLVAGSKQLTHPGTGEFPAGINDWPAQNNS